MKRLATLFISFFAVTAIAGAGSAAIAMPAAAQVDVFKQCTEGNQSSSAICKGNGKLFGPGSIWNNILNMITFLVGAVAVLMLIIGGLRYVLSNGDPVSATSAKNTIIYAVIGLILAAMANAIVNFVLSNI